MLVFEKLNASVVPEISLVTMLNALSVGHVSRYPINVKYRMASEAWLVDSRLPLKQWTKEEAIAIINFSKNDNGKDEYHLYSKRIKNEKFSNFSPGYNTRQTSDAKKALRQLKDIATSLEPKELARRSESIYMEMNSWAREPVSEINNLVSQVRREDVLNEVLYLASVGVQFKSDIFKKISVHGRELQLEAIRREKAASSENTFVLYVYQQPDGIVTVIADGRMNSGMANLSWTYENMESVPDVIRQQIALLNLCEEDEYVPEVGKRDPQKGYWVQVDREKFTPST